jgi:hypothetical protein
METTLRMETTVLACRCLGITAPDLPEGSKVEAIVVLPQQPKPLHNSSPRLPDFISSEGISAPFDLPRSSQPAPLDSHSGQSRLPDAIGDEAPERKP